jgi:hypothetical protein
MGNRPGLRRVLGMADEAKEGTGMFPLGVFLPGFLNVDCCVPCAAEKSRKELKRWEVPCVARLDPYVHFVVGDCLFSAARPRSRWGR